MGSLPGRPELPLTFRPLLESVLVGVHDYGCGAGPGGPDAEEVSFGHSIVLMRHGAFRRHFGRRSVTADVNQVMFFSNGSTYRVSHPAERGDRGTVFVPSARILKDIIRELDPAVDDHPDSWFPFETGPCEPALFAKHRSFVLRQELATSDPIEPLWSDVTALQLVADALEAAYERHGLSGKKGRRGTGEDHAGIAETAKTYLASRLSERVTLEEVARAANASPFHFARVFQKQTGVPIHRYLTRLRLRASLDRLSGGEGDLTGLAFELGFSSHAHFTNAFRAEFGETPSEVRRRGRRAIGEMSKIP